MYFLEDYATKWHQPVLDCSTLWPTVSRWAFACKLQWLAHTGPDTSSSSLHVFWRMLVFIVLMKHIAWWAEWSLLAALKTWQCKMAANWEHLSHYEDRKSLWYSSARSLNFHICNFVVPFWKSSIWSIFRQSLCWGTNHLFMGTKSECYKSRSLAEAFLQRRLVLYFHISRTKKILFDGKMFAALPNGFWWVCNQTLWLTISVIPRTSRKAWTGGTIWKNVIDLLWRR